MNVAIGISEDHLKSLSTMLNTLLADEYVLYTKTRRYHWNVTGMSFMELHKLFESQYNELDEVVDSVAERTRKLGHFALGSLKQFLDVTRLLEDDEATDSKQMIQNLVNDHETIIRILRVDVAKTADEYKDAGTSDFLTGLLEKHESMAWFLRAHLG